ncbi:MAG: hypothetical protein IJ628_02445, partial [Bacteroidaceae bacterium]|nr:hypothetical protein [Bacteroidaceae bacterium]
GVAVRQELPLQQGVDAACYQVMHHAVAELSREYLPFHRVFHHEGYRAARLISAFVYFSSQIQAVTLEVHLKLQGVQRISLPFQAVVESLYHISQADAARLLFIEH